MMGTTDSLGILPHDQNLTKSMAEALLELKDRVKVATSFKKTVSLEEVEERSSPQPLVMREKEIHYVVKIPCRYCSVLNDQLRSK
jgi:hypothetical protein